MASTNKTTNFNLSQYIGTDKPTYLSDYNTDMLNIDTGMQGNKVAIGDLSALTTTNKSDLVSALNEVKAENQGDSQAITDLQTNQGQLSSLTTTEKSNLVGAINEVKSENTTQGTAIATNSSAINELQNKFKLTNNTSQDGSNITSITNATTSGKLYLSQNSDGSLFKLYGRFQIDNITQNTTSTKVAIPGLTGNYGIKTNLRVAQPQEAYIIISAGTYYAINGQAQNYVVNDVIETQIAVGTDGYIYLEVGNSNSRNYYYGFIYRYIFDNCLYFNENFNTPIIPTT